jgi:hypothetical protein
MGRGDRTNNDARAFATGGDASARMEPEEWSYDD